MIYHQGGMKNNRLIAKPDGPLLLLWSIDMALIGSTVPASDAGNETRAR
jgi:hypothetical protein